MKKETKNRTEREIDIEKQKSQWKRGKEETRVKGEESRKQQKGDELAKDIEKGKRKMRSWHVYHTRKILRAATKTSWAYI